MSAASIIALVVLLGILTLVSYVDSLYAEMGKFLSREFQENIEVYEQEIEPRLKVNRSRVSLSMAVLVPITMAGIALVIGVITFMDRAWTTTEIVQAAVSILLIVIVFNRLLPFVFFTRTRGAWLRHFVWPLRILIYLTLPVTLVLGFCLSVAALTEERPPEKPEHPSEAVDALIERTTGNEIRGGAAKRRRA